MKKNNKIILLGLLIIAISVAGCAQPPTGLDKANTQTTNNPTTDNTPNTGTWQTVNKDQSSFEFEGYGPGKSHLGTFNDFNAELLIKNGAITGAKGVITTASVSTGIEGLDTHLRSEDFFNTAAYPDITFTSTSINDNTMTGELTFLGVTNTISFPVIIDGTTITADFLLDTTPYGMKYIGVNKEVRIAFTMTI